MKIRRKSNLVCWLTLALVFLFSQPVSAQDQLLREYASSRKGGNTLCFYPSTLRMLNLAQNEAYNKMVNGVEKLLVFQLDSTAIADQSYFGLIEEYQLLGFEEYISIMGSTQNIFIYGNDQKTPQMIGFVAIPDSGVYAFYLTGLIDFTRIPQMITAFQENEFLNLSNFALDGRRKNTGNKKPD